MKHKRQGFTLVEILVVIVIVALLAALLFSVFTPVREQGRKTTCASNLKQVGLAFLQYAQDNSETFPPAFIHTQVQKESDSAFYKIQPYLRSTQNLACPSDDGPSGFSSDARPLHEQWGTSYSYNPDPTASSQQSTGGWCFLPQNSSPPQGLDQISISRVKSPTRVVLALETCGIFPFSWHEQSSFPENNSRSNVCFVDGHVKFVKVFHDDTNFPQATDYANCYDPPGTSSQTSAYEYQWSATP